MMRKFLLAGAIVAALLPVPTASAQQNCVYELQLSRAIVASTLAPPPTGYDYADQPSTGIAPGDGAPLSVLLRSGQGCGTSGVVVALQARDAGRSDFKTSRTATTNGRGEVLFEPRPTRTAVVRAQVTAPNGQQLTSASLTVLVRAAVTATYTRDSGCALVATGSTYPAKPNHPVYLQTAVGNGYSTVARQTTDSAGKYRLRWNAPCGSHNLVVTVPASASNSAGRTLYERQGVTAR